MINFAEVKMEKRAFLVKFVTDTPNATPTGSCFFIKHQGIIYLCTAEHVDKNKPWWSVWVLEGPEHHQLVVEIETSYNDQNRVFRHRENDILLIRMKDKELQKLQERSDWFFSSESFTDPEVGDRVSIEGYPNVPIEGYPNVPIIQHIRRADVSVSLGVTIIKRSYTSDFSADTDTIYIGPAFELPITVSDGTSGGPVYSEGGRLYGFVTQVAENPGKPKSTICCASLAVRDFLLTLI